MRFKWLSLPDRTQDGDGDSGSRGTEGRYLGHMLSFKEQWDIQKEMWSKKLNAGWSSDRKSQRPGSSLSCLHCWGPTKMPRGSLVDPRMERPKPCSQDSGGLAEEALGEVRTSRKKNRDEEEAGRENSGWIWVGRGEADLIQPPKHRYQEEARNCYIKIQMWLNIGHQPSGKFHPHREAT